MLHSVEMKARHLVIADLYYYSQDASVVRLIIVVFIYCIRLFDMGMCIISHLKFICTQK